MLNSKKKLRRFRIYHTFPNSLVNLEKYFSPCIEKFDTLLKLTIGRFVLRKYLLSKTHLDTMVKRKKKSSPDVET